MPDEIEHAKTHQQSVLQSFQQNHLHSDFDILAIKWVTIQTRNCGAFNKIAWIEEKRS